MKLENILIKRVGDKRSGTSETTGNEWANRDIILAFQDETGDSYICANVDEEVWNKLGLKEGSIASVNLQFRTKKFKSGFIGNEIKIIDN